MEELGITLPTFKTDLEAGYIWVCGLGMARADLMQNMHLARTCRQNMRLDDLLSSQLLGTVQVGFLLADKVQMFPPWN